MVRKNNENNDRFEEEISWELFLHGDKNENQGRTMRAWHTENEACQTKQSSYGRL